MLVCWGELKPPRQPLCELFCALSHHALWLLRLQQNVGAEPELPEMSQQAGWWNRKNRAFLGHDSKKFTINDATWSRWAVGTVGSGQSGWRATPDTSVSTPLPHVPTHFLICPKRPFPSVLVVDHP